MALPVNVNTGTVTGKFIDSAGNPLSGSVTFSPVPTSLVDAGAAGGAVIIWPNPTVVALDANGAFSVNLIATNDVDLNPNAWSYRVSIVLSNGATNSFNMSVNSGVTVDLANVIPLVSPVPGAAIPWQSYTPVLSNLVLGSGGTITGRYTKLLSTCQFDVTIVLGTGFNFTGQPNVTYPLPKAAGRGIFNIVLTSTGTNSFNGSASAGPASVTVYAINTASNAAFGAINNTAPFVWKATDTILVSGTFEVDP